MKIKKFIITTVALLLVGAAAVVTLVMWPKNPPVGSGPDVVSVAVGDGFLLILKSNNTLYVRGTNGDGQLANGSNNDQKSTVKVMSDVKAVSAGSKHSLILKTDGTLWAAGNNSVGQLGDGTTQARTAAVKILDGVEACSAGYSYSAALKKDGTLWVWGMNDSGLIDAEKQPVNTPRQIDTNVKAIVAGRYYLYAEKTDSKIYAYPNGKTIVADAAQMLAAGREFALYVNSGSLYGLGLNNFGQLGEGEFEQMGGAKIDDGVSAVAAGYTHSVYIKDGSLWTLGRNHCGQMGDATMSDRMKPVKVMDGVKAVFAGANNTVVLKNDNTLWGMGDNSMCQIAPDVSAGVSTAVLVDSGK